MSIYLVKVAESKAVKFRVGVKVHSLIDSNIYTVSSSDQLNNLYFKKYETAKRTREMRSHIEYMIENQPSVIDKDKVKICWPLYTAYSENNEFNGYLMLASATGDIGLDKLFNDENLRTDKKWQAFFDNTTECISLRLKVALNLAKAISAVHSLDQYYFVDITPSDILIASDGTVTLIHCDKVVISSSTNDSSIKAFIVTPYTPPEGMNTSKQDDLISESWDNFSLAVIIYQLFFGVHPYEADFSKSISSSTSILDNIKNNRFVHGLGSKFLSDIPTKHRNFKNINHKLKGLFQIAFSEKYGIQRPSAKRWVETLSIFLEDNNHGLIGIPEHVNAPIKVAPTSNITSSDATKAYTEDAQREVVATNLTNSESAPNQGHIYPTLPSQKRSFNKTVFILLGVGAVVMIGMVLAEQNSKYSYNEDTPLVSAVDEQIYSKSADDSYQSQYSVVNRNTDTLNNYIEPTTAKATITEQSLYVLMENANVRQGPNIDAPIVQTLSYNTEVMKTSEPLVREGEKIWINIATTDNVRGWMSSIVLSKFPRNILSSECGIRNNEQRYTVVSEGVNVRSYHSKDDENVIGVILKDETVCPYQYFNSNDRSVGAWLGFELINGNTGWIASSMLEREIAVDRIVEGDDYSETHYEEEKVLNEVETSSVKDVDLEVNDSYQNDIKNKDDIDERIGRLKFLANLGDIDAQIELGDIYSGRLDADRINYQESIKWTRMAANEGNSTAQLNMGLAYYYGQGVELDYVYAFDWFKKSADQGDYLAQWYVSDAYSKGLGVKANAIKSFEYMEKSARNSNEALIELGLKYYIGDGVEQDYSKAIDLLEEGGYDFENSVINRVMNH